MQTDITSQLEAHIASECKAIDFLTNHGIKFRATLSDSKLPPWRTEDEKSGHHYRVTLSKPGGRLTFDFWGSVADASKGITTVAPYDVLACISADAHCPETFADFCSEYGDDQDSIKALQTFRRCYSFAKRLRAFFTEAQIADLQEIQ